MVIGKGGGLLPAPEGKGKRKKARFSPAPPKDWAEPGFDDSSWARVPLASFRDMGPHRDNWNATVRLCLRARFRVTKRASLKFSATFRGGAILWVNGKEVARAHVGSDGPEAHAYPEEAYLDARGQAMRPQLRKKHPERFAKRTRVLDAVIPASALVNGVNVLALEIRRAPMTEKVYGKTRRGPKGTPTSWRHLTLESVKLVGAGAESEARSAGKFRVWNHSILTRVHAGDLLPSETLRPVRMVAARNAVASGQIVAGASGTISALKAKVSDFSGPGRIGAGAVTLRYALPDGEPQSAYRGAAGRAAPNSFSTLDESPREKIPVVGGRALQPIWISVRVPGGAKPGEYTGKLTVSAAGTKTVEVPLSLSVADWVMPDSRKFTAHVGLAQSPDSLAMKYGVEMWSDEHWRLIERSFELMGQVGNKTLFVPLLRQTHLGNRHSMVRWMRRGSNGKTAYDHDFSIAEKYVALGVKHMGEVPVACMYCWEPLLGATASKNHPKFKGRVKDRPLPFTIKDPANGKLTDAEGPTWGTPEVREFWKPVMDGMRTILARHGIEKSMMVGCASDKRPTKEAVEDLKYAASGAPWVLFSHPKAESIQGHPVGYDCDVWTVRVPTWPDEKRQYGWKTSWRRCAFPRPGGTTLGPLKEDSALARWYISVEGMQAAGMHGFGRCGADFWKVVKDRRGRTSSLLGVTSEWAYWGSTGMYNATATVLGPGKNGPAPTTTFEMIRISQQLTEARVYLERALLDDVTKGKLGAELAKRCQDLLDERTRAIMYTRHEGWRWLPSSGWQEREEKLYALCGEVAKKLK
jgi:hypothetical protein